MATRAKITAVAVITTTLTVSAYWSFTDSPLGDHPECPHTARVTVKDSVVHEDSVVDVAGPITNVPEFHDCQRFIVKGADGEREYNQLVAGWVSARIDSVLPDMYARTFDQIRGYLAGAAPQYLAAFNDSVAHIKAAGLNPLDFAARVFEVLSLMKLQTTSAPAAFPPVLTGLTAPPPIPVTQFTPIIVSGQAVPAVQVYNYAEEEYVPLHLQPKFNCIYVFFAPQPRAWVKATGLLNSCPAVNPGSLDSDARVHKLSIVPAIVPGAHDADYPNVVRWDWDDGKTEQYLGVKCGAAWCEIGDSTGFTSSERPEMPREYANAEMDVKRVYLIPGWYDRQYLAVAKDPAPTDPNAIRVKPSNVIGTVVPSPTLDNNQYTLSNGWQEVGRIYVSAPLEPYADKLNIGQNTSVRIIRQKRSLLGIWKARLLTAYKAEIEDPTAGDSPFDKPKPPTFGVTYRSMNTRTSVNVPGTVRWRWRMDDETVWDECPAGCCEIRPGK